MNESSTNIMSADEMTLFANTMVLSRLALNQGTTHEGKRDLYEVLGYRKDPSIEDYRFLFKRGDIAGRVVTAYPEAVWCHPPTLIEDENTQDRTTFEAAFDKFAKTSKLWHYIYRTDVLAQLGRYAVLLVGVADGKADLTEEVGKGKVAYLMSFGEDNAEIHKVETDPLNPRFGKPLEYKLYVGVEDKHTTRKEILVHYSRIIHVAERTLDNDVYGAPLLEGVINRFDDLEKVVGGGAETWWLNSRGGLNLNADKDVEIADPKALTEEAQNFIHKYSRLIKTKGVDVKAIDHAVHSPLPNFEVLMSIIAGATGIPKRILLGSERGELASGQDENNWSNRIDERRRNFCEPMILEQVLDLMKLTGELDVPEDTTWEWPELDKLSEKDKAEIASKKAQALATYANSPEADHLVTPQQFVEEVLCLEYREDELDKIIQDENDEIEAQLKLAEEQERKQQALNTPTKPNKPNEPTAK